MDNPVCCLSVPKNGRKRTNDRVVELKIDALHTSPCHPRTRFRETELNALAESIAQNGIIQPLAVREIGGAYELIAGERRLRAAEIAGLSRVPCLVYQINERDAAVLSLVENIQRASLDFFEEAEAIARLIAVFGLTQSDVAYQLGYAQSTIANKLRLLRLPRNLRELITQYRLSERHARAILKLPEDERESVLEYVIRHALNVVQTEQYISEITIKECENESIRKRSAVFQNTKIFTNTIDHAVETMQAAGIDANTRKFQRRGYVEYRIRIPALS